MSSEQIYKTPHIMAQASVPPPPPSAASRSARPALESPKTVLSAELFQRRHALEYAHLHSDAGSWELLTEEKLLAEERRLGRMRREKRAMSMNRDQENGEEESGWPKQPGHRAMSVDGTGRGTRPLSLVQKREQGHARSKTEVGLGIDVVDGSHSKAAYRSTSRPTSLTGLRPLSLRSSLVSPTTTTRPNFTPQEQSLEVLVERDSSPVPDRSSSGGDNSISHSTYSWATSFSGETTELRTAAQYVPSRAVTPDADESVCLDSPARKEQRRKRIVAIAHTVRQLEGIGSRDLEDPTFYNTLAKAWYERFEDKRKPEAQPEISLQSPAVMPPTPADATEPFVPDSESSLMALRRYHLPQGASPAEEFASPPDPEFITPDQGYEFQSARANYPRPKSMATSLDSRSIRYSYASTLHDLALEGMLQGSKLMREKAWLRPQSTVGTPWGGDFDAPPGLRSALSRDDEMDGTDGASSLDAPFEYDQHIPARTLRRVEGVVERPIRQRVVSDEKEALDSPRKLPAQSEAGPSTGGIGFVNAWWGSTPSSAMPTPTRERNVKATDFPFGEDGNSPTYPHQLQKKRKSMSISSAVLEPDHPIDTKKASLSPSDQMFLETLLRVTPRRRSCILTHRRHPSSQTRPRPGRRTARALSDPGQRVTGVQDETRGSVSLSPYLANYTPTRWTISSRLSAARHRSHRVSRDIQTDEALSQTEAARGSEEDGLTGLDSWSLRSISPLPTPPLDNGPSHSPMSQNRTRHLYPLSRLSERWGQAMRLEPPIHIQSTARRPITESGLLSPALILSDPNPTTRGLFMPTHSDEPIEEIESRDEPARSEAHRDIASVRPPHLATQTRSSSLPRDTSLWSSPAELPGTASLAAVVEARDTTPPGLPSLSTRIPGDERDALHHAVVSPAPIASDRDYSAPDVAQVAVAYRHQPRPKTSSKVLFWLGFILPLLWLFGAWPSQRQTDPDTEANPSSPVAATLGDKVQLRDLPWWRRWTYDPDPYVERCRWAAGVTVPLAVVGGVTAGILVAVL
ncbi:hypothetical protein DB88DRAFT_546983 [Papiliotrema laurentii]|uniref:Uncharacterized protein n=1 Tax=Papiliotrema laurentii TaxID=5418 RepID=A0AAD9FKR3_PAPLA|nr:hypothetical protein DB88DRAFT_546983 [Papiliotrema laurentii]